MITHLQGPPGCPDDARVDPPPGGMDRPGLLAQRRVLPLPVARLHRPDQSGTGQPLALADCFLHGPESGLAEVLALVFATLD